MGLVLVLIWVYDARGQKSPGTAKLHGCLKHFTNEVPVEDISDLQYMIEPSAKRAIVTDSLGKFSIILNITTPNYYKIGRNVIYLSPGDDMEVMINFMDQNASWFKGKGQQANNFLRSTPFPKGGSFLEAGDKIAASPQATLLRIDSLANARYRRIDSLTDVSEAFRSMERARVKADQINSLYAGRIYSIWSYGIKEDSARIFGSAYDAFIAPKVRLLARNFIDSRYMQLVVYRDIAKRISAYEGPSEETRKIMDWYRTDSFIKSMYKENEKSSLQKYAYKIDSIESPVYKAATEKLLQRLMDFGKGDFAEDFTAHDPKGNPVSLGTLAGKVIYIDMWATWCVPCMQEMPAFEELKKKFSDNKDVVFVSLSIDSGDIEWKKNLLMRSPDGLQWRIDRALLKKYNVLSIPRAVLIDKNFKIVQMDATTPSNNATALAITALLKN